MSQTPQYSIELLAPARNAQTAITALRCGADAIYIGAPSHGARAAATNSVADIAEVCEFAHLFNARVYVTLNTLVYDNELKDVERLICELYSIGVDALIVQDLGILRLDIPPIALHASTQCDIRTPKKALFLQELGFSQLVLPRELTLEEIRLMRSVVKVPLEVFIHGALCVSYSGACYASLLCGGRSANRGECAQICRLPYDLTDRDGNVLMRNKHLLSLRDLNRLPNLRELFNAGVSSLKIEGRLKDENYVKNVVSAYDSELRRLGVSRTSDGTAERTFTPDVSRSFNRGFTSHFLYSPMPAKNSLANFNSPKSIGSEVASVSAIKEKKIILKNIYEPISNGDGLNFNGGGFRVNRFESPNILHVTENISGLKPGTILRRNFDKTFTDSLNTAKYATRDIPLSARLRKSGNKVILEAEDGTAAVMQLPEIEAAKTPQGDNHRKIIAKLGDTIFRLAEFDNQIPDIFIPASALTELRRQLVSNLLAGRAARFYRPLRLPENAEAKCPIEPTNVANRLAAQVYRDHGITAPIIPAWEVKPPISGEHTVMTTRYCLRRELGACLKTPQGKNLPAELILTSPNIPTPLRLNFDCKNCQMQITLTPNA
ncbi:MAG: U32 family peptidase [Bacteroides sp.]|nr:U32 family peptidase [Bacteroides sp.]MCM1379832.1 U32 family peptidase [Bacteroides sp.]MCM1446191.1 U32 family peptidase [Prevotella sp.]